MRNMRNNPFSLNFGSEPALFIPRYDEQNRIRETFASENPSSHIFMLMGARGSGKTVLMTSVSHDICQEKNWIHIDLNSEGDLMNSLASQIYSITEEKYPRIKLNVSFNGLGISLEKEEKYYDIQTDIDRMLKTLDKKGIRVLITLDEASNSANIRLFTSYFQHCLREKLPVFLIMTGLFKNIRALQNNRSQTFLRRAPKIELEPLNIRRIAMQYKDIFKLDDRESDEMARLTGGYSYGFQVLGYLVFEAGKKKPDKAILSEYMLNLEECSYEKIWEELSEGERRVARAIAELPANSTVREIREKIGIDSNNFSTYQNVLQKSGILSKESAYGRVDFSLPFFREFVLGL